MKIRDKEEYLKELIGKLYSEGVKRNNIWKVVAEELNKPKRKMREVNLLRIEKYAKPKETIIVPGIVLGSGEIKKHVNIAALRFSSSAKEKIEKAGGKCLSIEELFEKNPEGKNIRVIG